MAGRERGGYFSAPARYGSFGVVKTMRTRKRIWGQVAFSAGEVIVDFSPEGTPYIA